MTFHELSVVVGEPSTFVFRTTAQNNQCGPSLAVSDLARFQVVATGTGYERLNSFPHLPHKRLRTPLCQHVQIPMNLVLLDEPFEVEICAFRVFRSQDVFAGLWVVARSMADRTGVSPFLLRRLFVRSSTSTWKSSTMCVRWARARPSTLADVLVVRGPIISIAPGQQSTAWLPGMFVISLLMGRFPGTRTTRAKQLQPPCLSLPVRKTSKTQF